MDIIIRTMDPHSIAVGEVIDHFEQQGFMVASACVIDAATGRVDSAAGLPAYGPVV